MYWFTIDGEGQQQFALHIIQLPGIDAVKEIAGDISAPDLWIDRILEERGKAQITGSQE